MANNNAKPHGISSRRSTIDEKELYNVAWKKPDHRLMCGDKNTLTPCLCCRRLNSTKENIFCTRFFTTCNTLPFLRRAYYSFALLFPSLLTIFPSLLLVHYSFEWKFSLPTIVLYSWIYFEYWKNKLMNFWDILINSKMVLSGDIAVP